MIKRSLTAALLGGAAVLALQLPAIAAPNFVTKQAAGEMSSSGLIGTKIQNGAGENVGDVNYLVLDDSGHVTTVVIGVGGFLGVGEKNIAVPFKDVTKQQDNNGNTIFVLNASKDELSSAPAYEWTEKGAMQKLTDKAKAAGETVKEKTEGMTRADEPTPSTTGPSDGTTGAAKPADTPAETK